MPRRSSVKRSLAAIERGFRSIEVELARLAKRVRTAERQATRKPRRGLKITPKRRAQLKLQGAYMGFMRQLKAAQKARVKAVKEKRGFQAAIRLARRLRR
jgi:hypothetical protein